MRVDLFAQLQHCVFDRDAGRAAQLLQFRQRIQGGLTRLRGDTDQQRRFPAGRRGAAIADLPHFGFERLNQIEAVDGKFMGLERLAELIGRTRGLVGQNVGPVHFVRPPLVVDRDGGHGIQPQQRKVRQIVIRQTLVFQMGVDAAHAAQPSGKGAVLVQLGQENRLEVADHHIGNLAAAVDQQTNLALNFERQLRQVARQLRGDQKFGRDFAAVEILQTLEMVMLQPLGIAPDRFHAGFSKRV